MVLCGDGDRHELLNLVMMPPSNLTKNIQLRTSPAPAALFNTVVKIQGFYVDIESWKNNKDFW